MADDPDFTLIKIRNPQTLEERDIAKHALDFWPGWERIDSQGRPVRAATSTTEKKEH